MAKLRINVLGVDFSIAAKEDERYLTMLLENYKNMVRIIEKNNSESPFGPEPLKISILAGIMLCDELYKAKHRNPAPIPAGTPARNPEQDEVERITLKLIEKIDKALG